MRRFSTFAWALAALALAFPAWASAGPTVVSLTFDDGWANQSTARAMLAAHGMNATFYVNTNTLGTSGFLSWADLEAINAEGHEIAGHTLDHVDLPTVGSAEARRQVCDDRANLLARGFVATSFAYPYGEYDTATKAIVKDCGYASGRGAFGLRNITAASDSRPYAGPIPPPDPYAVLTPCCIRSDVTLSALQNYITQAESKGGGWIPLVLHAVCTGCGDSPPSIAPATLAAFLDWLEPRAANGTVVRTVSQVITGDAHSPSSSIACGGTSCSAGWYTGPVSVSLSATDAGGSGVSVIRYTTDGSEPTVSSATYTGPFAVTATTTVRYRAWDNAGNVEAAKAQTVPIDAVAPNSSISCNSSACSSSAYGGPVTISLAADDVGDSGVAAIRYTLDGSEPTASSTAYNGPFAVSATTTVQYRAWDNAGNAEATKSQEIQIDTETPTSSITCDFAACATGWYGDGVQVGLAAADGGSGVAAIRYTLDGSEPTASSTAYSGPFTVSATTTVTYRAWDNAGNIEATKSQLIQVDATLPVSSISCNSSACSGAAYSAPVTVALAATDAESGVAAIRYTLDGSEPTASSTAYSGPFTLTATSTVTYRAWDNAGNIEATKSQLIEVTASTPDEEPPTSSIVCDGAVCSGWYNAPVTVALSAADGGSGVAAIRYTLDGSEPIASSTAYSGPFTVSTTTTVKYRAWDNAGNAEPTNTELIQVDSTPPVSSVTCNGSACAASWYTASVTVVLSASDSASGVAVIRYTVDGSEPTASSTAYSGPFTVSATTTVKYRAWDNAGNPEVTKTQRVQIDTAPPTVAITSPANGATVKGNVKVTADAADADSGIAQVSFYVNGTLVGTRTAPPYSVNWQTTKLAKGQYTLTAVGRDAAGRTTTAAAVVVTVK